MWNLCGMPEERTFGRRKAFLDEEFYGNQFNQNSSIIQDSFDVFLGNENKMLRCLRVQEKLTEHPLLIEKYRESLLSPNFEKDV